MIPDQGWRDQQGAYYAIDWPGNQVVQEVHIHGAGEGGIALEQFLNTLPLEKWAWVLDKKPNSCVAAGELADEYEL